MLDLLRRGMTNAEIAALRARSPHTVAKQVGSVIEKTGASRQALAAQLPGTRSEDDGAASNA